MKSMPLDGSCAYHLASMAIYGTTHPDVPDIDAWPSDLAGARTAVVDNYLDMKEQVVKYLDEVPLALRSDQLSYWETMMSEDGSADSFLAAAVDLTKWGGTVELAVAMANTTTGVIIVHADNISVQATAVEVEGSVQPAMLEGLHEGGRKTHNVFAILRRNHYYLGYVKTEGTDHGLFKVGDESDSAKELLIEFLKRTNSDAIQRKRKRLRGKPQQASCVSEDDEPQENALASNDEPRKKRPSRERQRKPIAQSAESGPVSSEYDENQMVIYTCDDHPDVLLVGAVQYLAVYESGGEGLFVHRYGYASQGQAAWNLDYTKSFAPGYRDPEDNLFMFTFKPRRAYEKVEHEIVPGNVKAKFVLTKKNNQVPQTALRGGDAAALNTVVQPGQVSEY